MDFRELINNRRSVRKYARKAVEPEKMQAILDAVKRAPTAGNLQAYQVYVCTDPSLRQALAKASLDQEYVAEAPVVLAFCQHPKRNEQKYGERGAELYALQDTTIACTFAMLAATEQGLGSVWIGAFDDKQVKKLIGAHADQQPVALLPMGYAAESPEQTPRRELSEFVHQV